MSEPMIYRGFRLHLSDTLPYDRTNKDGEKETVHVIQMGADWYLSEVALQNLKREITKQAIP